MKAKFLLATLVSLSAITYPILAHCQNGTYTCLTQGYSKVDKSVDKLYSDKMIITLDIHPTLGGSIAINNITQELNFRYDIISKGQTLADKSDRTITNTYRATMVQNNVPVGDEVLIGIIEAMDNTKLGFWVFNERFKSYNQYLDLKKLQ